MYNRDIDSNIEKFYTMLREFDQYTINAYNSNRKEWHLNGSITGVVNKYWSALRRKTTKEEYYLKLKLIADADGTMLTSINNDVFINCTFEELYTSLPMTEFTKMFKAQFLYVKSTPMPIVKSG